jgi:phage-related protein
MRSAAVCASIQPVIDTLTFAIQTVIDTVAASVQTVVDTVALAFKVFGALFMAVRLGFLCTLVHAVFDAVTAFIQSVFYPIAAVVQALLDAVAAFICKFAICGKRGLAEQRA